MAEFNGITAERADEILGMSVVSGSINVSGHLILTRENGSTIDAGDFSAFFTTIMDASVDTAVDAATSDIPQKVAGFVTDMGDESGTLSFAAYTAETLVNAFIKVRCVGNVTVDVLDANFPADPIPGTQFAIRFEQDSIGSRTLSVWGGIKLSQGVLELTPDTGAIDIIVFIYDGTDWYAGPMGIDFQ